MEEGRFADKWRIESARLAGYDYSSDGYYFVTICTKDRELYFGDVLMDNTGEWSVALTPIGEIARDELLKTSKIRSNVQLDEWVIMPNHVHVIFEICNNNAPRRDGRGAASQSTQNASQNNPRYVTETPQRGFGDETPQRGRLYDGRGFRHSWHRDEWKPDSLGSIINQFKSICTKRIRKINPSFKWQTRYYDRIIHDERALWAIRHYIQTNSDRWQRDRNNPENIWY